MRLIKMFGLAAIAAVAAMAFVGASSASAQSTTLCKVDQLPCAALNQYPAGTHIEGTAVNPELLTGSATFDVKCTSSLALGKTLNQLANPLLFGLETLTFTGCKNGLGTACETKLETKGDILVLKTAKNLATGESHNNSVNVKCGFFVNCTYGGLPKVTLSSHTQPPHLTANKAVLGIVGGGLCPAAAEWDALYKLTLPLPLFISS